MKATKRRIETITAYERMAEYRKRMALSFEVYTAHPSATNYAVLEQDMLDYQTRWMAWNEENE